MAKLAAKANKATAKPIPNMATKKAGRKPAAKASDTADAVGAAIAALNSAISADQLESLSSDLMQRLMASVVRAYSAKVQAGEPFLPFDDRTGRVTPTDVMITASGFLKAADLQVFELGMWQSYTGR